MSEFFRFTSKKQNYDSRHIKVFVHGYFSATVEVALIVSLQASALIELSDVQRISLLPSGLDMYNSA